MVFEEHHERGETEQKNLVMNDRLRLKYSTHQHFPIDLYFVPLELENG